MAEQLTQRQQWFTPSEAGAYLRISRGFVYRLTQHHGLRAHALTDTRRRYRREDLDALLRPLPVVEVQA